MDLLVLWFKLQCVSLVVGMGIGVLVAMFT